MTQPPKKLSDDDLQRVSGGTTAGADDLPGPEGYFVDQHQAAGDKIMDVIQELKGEMDRRNAPVEHIGDASANFLMGSDAPQEIFLGGGGADFMFGGGGQDVFYNNDGDRASDFIAGGTGDDTFVWGPGSGNDMFFGEAGRDTVVIEGLNIDQLKGAFMPEQPGMMWRVSTEGDFNVITCQRPGGEPTSFNGTIRVGDEMVTVSGVERLMVPR